MKKQTILFATFLILVMMYVISSCKKDDDTQPQEPTLPTGAIEIPATPQVTSGDANAGWDFLRYGNYIGAGIPINTFRLFYPDDNENLLERTGENATISNSFNAFDINGVTVVGGFTCMHCHSGKINGEYVKGLGNSLLDFSGDYTGVYSLLDGVVASQYGTSSPEWDAYAPISRGIEVTAPYVQAPFQGVSTAAMLAVASVAHRNPDDLSWSDTPLFTVNPNIVASDIPPLWHLKKKNALYYNAMGRGDFTKHLMQTIVVAISDSTEARTINNDFDDVMAWINTLEPPAYTASIDAELVETGKAIFESTCSQCHGTYGANETYPNLLLHWNAVGTDSAYANYAAAEELGKNWFNSSWFAQSDKQAESVTDRGYIAPPLDGIWATAPYLHNGSVPTLEDLLNSSQRPTYWKRTFEDTDYDFTKVGWNYTVESGGGATDIYDTSLYGCGNQGHTYGDPLDANQRAAVIEYLKTL